MPTEKPRITFTISQDQLDMVDNYRFDNKFKNQTQAILSLIEKGLSDFETKTAPSISDEAMKLAKDYDNLDCHGQRVVRLVADEELARCIEQEQPAPSTTKLFIAARDGSRIEVDVDDDVTLPEEDSQLPR